METVAPPVEAKTPPTAVEDDRKPAPEAGGNGRIAPQGQPKGPHSGPPPYATEALIDAESLLKYAAETGTTVDDPTRAKILAARAAAPETWNEQTIAGILDALTKLAAQLKPVSAESLSRTINGSRPTFRAYVIVSIFLAVIIVLFSSISFVTSALSKSISADIVTANELAAKLRSQLGAPATDTNSASSKAVKDPSQPPPGVNPVDVITELQLYASTIRAIDARAQQLNRFTVPHEPDPYFAKRSDPTEMHRIFQLDVGLTNLWDEAEGRTRVYQRVRSYAQSILDNVAFSYGAVAACVLPVLYALFGTCAYLLRSFEQQILARTFIPSSANSARFLIAAIGGTVVGLFNFTITQGASIPPLALAFLVGYAVDVFFTFLEGILQTFTKKTGPG